MGWDEITTERTNMKKLPVPGCCVLLALCVVTPGHALGQAKSPLIDVHMHVWSDDLVRFPFAHPYDKKFVPPKIPN